MNLVPKSANFWRCHRADLLLMAMLALGTGVLVFALQRQLNPIIYDELTVDAWFDSDIPRIFNNLTDPNSDHYRTNVHPLFSLFSYPFVRLLLFIPGLTAVTAVQTFTAAAAALWMALLFILLRLVTGRRLDAAVFSLLALSSAAAFFWLAVPETYSLASATLIIPLIFSAAAGRRLPKAGILATAASALSLSMFITNWLAGLLVTAVHFPPRRAVRITFNALALVLLLWGVQKTIFPTAGFLLERFQEENRFILSDGGVGPLEVARSFFLHTLSMPELDQRPRHLTLPPYPTLLLTQTSPAGSGSIWGAFAVMLWAGLLVFGLKGMLETRSFRPLRLVLVILLLSQFILYLVYGDETFLYSLNTLPLLILWAAMGCLARERRVVLVMAGLMAVTAALNNYTQFQTAAAFFDSPVIVADAQSRSLPIPGEELPFGRDIVLAAMRRRPGDPWPRGFGHVILAIPGSPEIEKGYYEPGGSFSPAAGSFGLSFWVLNNDGRLLATSDSLPLASIEQRFVWPNGAEWPGIQTTTPYYEATWLPVGAGEWRLSLSPNPDLDGRIALAVRSVGPAGGPINRLAWENGRLMVNGRWQLAPSPAPGVHLGHEGDDGWLETAATATTWEGQDGWGYARLLLTAGQTTEVTITDESPSFVPVLTMSPASERLNLDLPGEHFTAALDAQVAHLQMSLVGEETRPGDPLNYPLTWQRDAAYIIMALIRAGQLQPALAPANHLAANDFFGGFGAEADAPGLALWALTELAAHLDDPAYNQSLWPHIARKAGLIEEMMSAQQPVYKPFTGPVIPRLVGDPVASLVADPARDGLIIGRMDHHRPLLYVNAVNYQGLLAAAAFAQQTGHQEEAARWQSAALNLRRAWQQAFLTPEVTNERTYISSLWPTWIAAPELTVAYEEKLEQRWQMFRTPDGGYQLRPLWTYFEIGEAHQWLYLERPDRVWDTLEWFWDNQAAPGLFTWWEGAGEENTFNQWPKVRGWVDPLYVSPHYWTSAEMLLLQMEMLVYTRPDGTTVIGGGVPESWLDSPLHAGPLPTAFGSVEWSWDGEALTVIVQGEAGEIVPGPAFEGRPIQIR